ncbi:MAG: hypothetical protein NVS3B10_00220 [Polyangiales bacterium]
MTTARDAQRPERRVFRSNASLRHGEVLFLDSSALDAEFAPSPDAARALATGDDDSDAIPGVRLADGGIGVVTVSGPLEHHGEGGFWSFFDSYDAILCRLERAFCCEQVRAIVVCFDSPGGDANGTVESHRAIRSLIERHGKKLYAYSNENCYSAAYALASAASEIWLPETGGVGSVGVISQVVGRVAQNKQLGLDVRLLTTGARKSDSHPDRPITKDVVDSLQARVDQFGESFFGIVAESRGMTVDDVKALEAGVFIGQSAVTAKLADHVGSFEELLSYIRDSAVETAPPSTSAKAGTHQQESAMKTFEQLVKALDDAKATLAKASTTDERASAYTAIKIAADALAKYDSGKKPAAAPPPSKMKKKAEEEDEESEEEDEEEEAEDADDSDDSDDDADADEDDDSDDDADSEEDEEEDESEDEEEEDEEADEEAKKAQARVDSRLRAMVDAKAAFVSAKGDARLAAATKYKASVRALRKAKASAKAAKLTSLERAHSALLSACVKLTGRSGKREMMGALDAIQKRLDEHASLKSRVSKLEGVTKREKVDAMLSAARRDNRITKAQIEPLRAQGLKDKRWLKGYLATLPKIARSIEDGALRGTASAGSDPSKVDMSGESDVLSQLSDEQRKFIEASWKSRQASNPKLTVEDVAREVVANAKKARPEPSRH